MEIEIESRIEVEIDVRVRSGVRGAKWNEEDEDEK
jgi:hypothetical protein